MSSTEQMREQLAGLIPEPSGRQPACMGNVLALASIKHEWRKYEAEPVMPTGFGELA